MKKAILVLFLCSVLFGYALTALIDAENRGYTPLVIESTMDGKNKIGFVLYSRNDAIPQKPIIAWCKNSGFIVERIYPKDGMVVCNTTPENFERVFKVKPYRTKTYWGNINSPDRLVHHWMIKGTIVSKKAGKELPREHFKILHDLPAKAEALGISIVEPNTPIFLVD